MARPVTECFARCRERRDHAVRIADGRHADLEMALRRFDRDVGEAVLVAREVLEATVDRDVHVRVDESRRDVFSPRIDDARAARRGDVFGASDGGDASAAHDDRCVREWRAAVAVDQRAANDGNDRIGALRDCGRGKEQAEKDDEKSWHRRLARESGAKHTGQRPEATGQTRRRNWVMTRTPAVPSHESRITSYESSVDTIPKRIASRTSSGT